MNKWTLRLLTLAAAIGLSLTVPAMVASASVAASASAAWNVTAAADSILQPDAAEGQVQPDSDADSDIDPAKRKHARMHHHAMKLITDAAGIIGIAPDALKKELKAGKSIVEVAKAKGIEETDLTSKLLADRMKKIDEAVQSGKWTAEKAEKMKQHLPDHLKHMLNHKGFHKSRDSEKKE
ncbi:hypothetical protein [Paenibacillus koleovorans]|uniref:hypothetical protein n=1 Tax=Paenibacillus koleovorans TaxID=121608 RepID=UPI000FD87788|nr:hypothetical protein [Paenibacillus koleovorans]